VRFIAQFSLCRCLSIWYSSLTKPFLINHRSQFHVYFRFGLDSLSERSAISFAVCYSTEVTCFWMRLVVLNCLICSARTRQSFWDVATHQHKSTVLLQRSYSCMETLACSLILHITIIDGLAWQALYQLHKEHWKKKEGKSKFAAVKMQTASVLILKKQLMSKRACTPFVPNNLGDGVVGK